MFHAETLEQYLTYRIAVWEAVKTEVARQIAMELKLVYLREKG